MAPTSSVVVSFRSQDRPTRSSKQHRTMRTAAASGVRLGRLRATRNAFFTCCASQKHRLVFLGTPDVAASILQQLHDACALPTSSCEIAAVVSQPGRPRGRGRKTQGDAPPSPVAQLAMELGMDEGRIWTPKSARDEAFLDALRNLKPDLCITAAYGNVLPNAFLAIPKRGTVNIHPSLLPKYRGAAPVQRALEAGDEESGVTLAFTVQAMDAGPIIAREKVAVEKNVRAPEFLNQMFDLGSKLLMSHLPTILDGTAAENAMPQDEEQATHAKKVTKEEALLDFAQSAEKVHNKVRAFAGWPGTVANLAVHHQDRDEDTKVLLKVETTKVLGEAGAQTATTRVEVDGDSMRVVCGDGSIIELLEVKPPGKRSMTPGAWVRGFRTKCNIRWV
mmetsp:Transcript_2505/g.8933  ORF Transcript_2505/g.8933 Transcript_2505/m.8933 type:complete len:391 (-) Transcript_2505:912-2084(-)